MASQRPTGDLLEMMEKQAKDLRKIKRRLGIDAQAREDIDALEAGTEGGYALIAEKVADGTSSSLNLGPTIPQTHRHLYVVFSGSVSVASDNWMVRFQDAGGNTNHRYSQTESRYSAGSTTITGHGGASRFPVGRIRSQAGTSGMHLWIYNYTLTEIVSFQYTGWTATAGTSQFHWSGGGFYLGGSTIDRLNTNTAGANNFDAGSKIEVFGVGKL